MACNLSVFLIKSESDIVEAVKTFTTTRVILFDEFLLYPRYTWIHGSYLAVAMCLAQVLPVEHAGEALRNRNSGSVKKT